MKNTLVSLLVVQSLLLLAGATYAQEWRYVQLPFRLSESPLVFKTNEAWAEYVAGYTADEEKRSAPCDLSQEMLVAWRAGMGSSGCSAPKAGIAAVQTLADRVRVEFFSGYAEGFCQAYYRPEVAACLPATNLPVEVVP